MTWTPTQLADLLVDWAKHPDGRRWSPQDLLDALRPDREPETQPEIEPEVPSPTTPFEHFVDRCAQRGFDLVDYRDLDQWPRRKKYDWREWGWPADKSRGAPYGTRSWNQTTAIWLHTYAVSNIGPKRFLGVPAQLGIASNGTPILMHHLWRLLAHGHAANRFSVGIEIAGRSDFDSDAQIETARDMVRYVVDERKRNMDPDGPYAGPMVIGAHRQSHRSRTRDPGRRIWCEVGEWAIEELGLGLGPVVGSGRGIEPWRSTT